MKEVLIVAIVFGSILLALAIIPGTILLAIKFFRGGLSAEDQAEETKMIQEIYKGLARMENRVEALEAILLDQEGSKRAQQKGS
ncbi:MAG: phage-shock protein [Deltaproteobacteria bacterium]|jgi:phage shock protein B|nr:phage-shock protein [Deltaproteobacteria bacterium]MBW2470269.1 phage-shock protein [Deltaproteobacteria bacterium]MBW2489036.1 phage-shock protein [Deltaproteobacteria bacterium]MBW2516366.1 phage-shock protein [Deltaproteobacteria bacterium]